MFDLELCECHKLNQERHTRTREAIWYRVMLWRYDAAPHQCVIVYEILTEWHGVDLLHLIFLFLHFFPTTSIGWLNKPVFFFFGFLAGRRAARLHHGCLQFPGASRSHKIEVRWCSGCQRCDSLSCLMTARCVLIITLALLKSHQLRWF